MSSHQISHVIFDCDGLLLDTESIYSEVIGALCSKYGHTFNWDLKAKQMGRTERESAQVLIDYFQLPITVDDYVAFTEKGYIEHFPSSKLLPGAERLVRHLHAHGVPIAVATGSSEFKYNLKITNHKELFSLFSHIVFASDDPDVRQSKPCPDVFNVCAERFPGEPPSNKSKVLVFEDAPNGVEASYSAGFPCIFIPDPNLKVSEDVKEKATTILSSLEDFIPEQYGLPAYDS
ncbi:pseudouridine-5'-phosphatase-like [Watersipora subatra]|uniref:pseudouridine-5'-phosphatase-like n=1 Tax=Watersipora subatra TaxID=2589382 RepID=UPI00355B3D24